MESELIEKIANDVLDKLNRVYVGDLDQQIAKLEQLAQLQHQFYQNISSFENLQNHRATVQRVTELKMERSVRMLRLKDRWLNLLPSGECAIDVDDHEGLDPAEEPSTDEDGGEGLVHVDNSAS
ncbi:hypothetical protein E2542_SST06028 [Spatholobus suberectus]|nr:hypothetical protein E2542_SST06028 [Spatholobus suberectus]